MQGSLKLMWQHDVMNLQCFEGKQCFTAMCDAHGAFHPYRLAYPAHLQNRSISAILLPSISTRKAASTCLTFYSQSGADLAQVPSIALWHSHTPDMQQLPPQCAAHARGPSGMAPARSEPCALS